MNLQAKKSEKKYSGTKATHISSLSLAVAADGKKGKKYIAVGMLKGLLVQIKIYGGLKMSKFKNAKDFYNKVTRKDYAEINQEKAKWYVKNPYMDFATELHDFYTDALKKGFIEEKEDNITVEYFNNLFEEKLKLKGIEYR
jgi:hypothetical protein